MTQLATTNTGYSSLPTIYPCGLDAGNEDTCFSTFDRNGTPQNIVIPSAVSEITSSRHSLLSSSTYGVKAIDDPYRQNIEVTYRGRSYFVGYMTYRQSDESGTQRGDQSRYYSVEQIIRLLATSGLVIKDSEYEIDLVTNIPLKYYANKLRKLIRDTFDGPHEFVLNGVSRKVTINVKKVMFEGYPATILCDPSTVSGKRLIIDGGRHTTEFIMLDGREQITNKCSGEEIGVQVIADYLYERVLENYGRSLTNQEISDALRAYGSRNISSCPEIVCGEKDIPSQEIFNIIGRGAKLLSEKIVNKAGTLWGNVDGVVASEIKNQFFIGGMPFFISEELNESMPRLKAIDDPEKANARGCAFVSRSLQMARNNGF